MSAPALTDIVSILSGGAEALRPWIRSVELKASKGWRGINADILVYISCRIQARLLANIKSPASVCRAFDL
jgi:hypothetical protein